MHSPSNNNGNLDPNQTMRLEQQRAELRSAKLPHYLDVQNMHKTSVTKKVDFKLLKSLPKFDGSNTPTLREWLEAILGVLLHIPGGADDPSMLAWLMHSAVSGRAKEVIATENDRLRNLGLPELHAMNDQGQQLMGLLYITFPMKETNLFLLNLLQVVRIHWRDSTAPTENLRQFQQRFEQHQLVAGTHVGNQAQMFSEYTARMFFISALPTEIQSLITTQDVIAYDDPHLSPAAIAQLYDLIHKEFDLRSERGESLTPQRKYDVCTTLA